jgi:hypothetical protein
LAVQLLEPTPSRLIFRERPPNIVPATNVRSIAIHGSSRKKGAGTFPLAYSDVPERACEPGRGNYPRFLGLVRIQFTDQTANSNSPGTPNPGGVASLSQTGTVQLLNTAGSDSVTIQATDNDYQNPTGIGTLSSSASNTYTHATNGDSQSFQSWFNQSNALGATDTPSPSVTLTAMSPPDPNSHAGDSAPTPAPVLAPFGLTNSMIIALSRGAAGALAQEQFTGSTTITATSVP